LAHLVFQTAYPGDLFLSIPLLKRIRQWSGGKDPVALVCRPGLGDFFLREKLVEEVFEVNKSSQESSLRIQHSLRGLEWDTIICPHESWRTQTWIGKLPCKRGKVGFRNWRNFHVFQHRVARRKKWPDALRQLSLLSVFDEDLAARLKLLEMSKAQDNVQDNAHTVDFSLRPIPNWASMTLRRNSGHGLGESGAVGALVGAGASVSGGSRVVCLAPGSVWETKRWTGSGFVDVGRALVARGYEVIVVGAPSEREYCAQVAAQIPRSRNLAGQTSVTEMIDLFSSARALVTNDSGAMHMAAVADLPTVGVFGPTTLELGYRPWQDRAVVVQTDLACRPCGKHGARACPLANHKCMTDVRSSHVLTALEKWL
jgi:heptosyltransferase-2